MGLSVVIGVLAGLIPATMAARLKIVDALRRVA
jgi:ABC-type antimicrobial peptide transport system permease subunit